MTYSFLSLSPLHRCFAAQERLRREDRHPPGGRAHAGAAQRLAGGGRGALRPGAVGRKNGGRCMENGEKPGGLEGWNVGKIIPTDFPIQLGNVGNFMTFPFSWEML